MDVMRDFEQIGRQQSGQRSCDELITKYRWRRPKISIEIGVASGKETDGPHPLCRAAVESFLHDAFLLLNIAAPASCNFYLASLKSRTEKSNNQTTNLSLSSTNFELAFLNGESGRWPSARMIDVGKTADWIFSVRRGVTQIPHSRMEKVLFALLHIAKVDLSPVTIVWIFYALETLFDTQPGENRRSLRDRAKLLLSPSNKQAAVFGENLRQLYDYRSKLVHGGLEVIHPMHNEGLDGRVEEKYWELAKVAEFGFAFLLASVQAIIERGLQEPRFAEVLSGDGSRGV